MKVAILFLAFAFVAISSVSGYSGCNPPTVNDQVFPKQYAYNHGESVSVGYPHKYFLRCMDGQWI